MNLPTLTAEQLAPLLAQSDEDLWSSGRQVGEQFLPDDALFSASMRQRLQLYVSESFGSDLRRWGQKGAEILDQLSQPDSVSDVKVVAAVAGFVAARLLNVHDLPTADIAAFALLLIRLYRKNAMRDAGS